MTSTSLRAVAPARIVMLCDWLPPDFGAVGQYAVGFARELADAGHLVTLVGFSSKESSVTVVECGSGSLQVRRLYRPPYNKGNLVSRALWTLKANLLLLWGARAELMRCEEIRFTGSPPYLLHFVMPFACARGIRTRYRITDFHPECLIATVGPKAWLTGLSWLTNFWRRKVSVIEVLGDDQARRLAGTGVDPARIVLRRDPSPVEIPLDTQPAQPPAGARGRKVVLYSGNWGVAHDHMTFVEGYAQFCMAHPDTSWLWLNATGKRLDAVTNALTSMNLPAGRTEPVPIEELPGVLCAADVHLITLDDRFVGYVMPSKVYACIASRRPILFIGSAASDVHALCVEGLEPHRYRRVDTGDAAGVRSALENLLGVGLPAG